MEFLTAYRPDACFIKITKSSKIKVLTARGPQHDFVKNRNGVWTTATFSIFDDNAQEPENCVHPASGSTTRKKKKSTAQGLQRAIRGRHYACWHLRDKKSVILSGVLMVETTRGRLCGSESIGFTWQNTHGSKIEGKEISRV